MSGLEDSTRPTKLLDEGHKAGIIPSSTQVEFVE
jgi:hypothetical protein